MIARMAATARTNLEDRRERPKDRREPRWFWFRCHLFPSWQTKSLGRIVRAESGETCELLHTSNHHSFDGNNKGSLYQCASHFRIAITQRANEPTKNTSSPEAGQRRAPDRGLWGRRGSPAGCSPRSLEGSLSSWRQRYAPPTESKVRCSDWRCGGSERRGRSRSHATTPWAGRVGTRIGNSRP